jgi:hypothetical protein
MTTRIGKSNFVNNPAPAVENTPGFGNPPSGHPTTEGGMYPQQVFTPEQDIVNTDSEQNITGTKTFDSIVLKDFGAGNNDAESLNKDESGYTLAVATDGTVIEKDTSFNGPNLIVDSVGVFVPERNTIYTIRTFGSPPGGPISMDLSGLALGDTFWFRIAPGIAPAASIPFVEDQSSHQVVYNGVIGTTITIDDGAGNFVGDYIALTKVQAQRITVTSKQQSTITIS